MNTPPRKNAAKLALLLPLLMVTACGACGGGEADSPAAAIKHCRDRASTIGVLLEQADRQAEEFAGAAEQHADEVRTLMRVVANDRSLLPPAGLGLKPGTSTLIDSPADAQAQ